MDKETVITGLNGFVSIHLPSYESCPPDLLNFSILDDSKPYSAIPKPYITIDESYGFQQQFSEPDQFDQFASCLELAINNLSLISPLSITRRPSHSYNVFSKLRTPEIICKEPNPELENNPQFQELKNRINSIKSIFDSNINNDFAA